MPNLRSVAYALGAMVFLLPQVARSEGTIDLGPLIAVSGDVTMSVDVLEEGEVINIAAGFSQRPDMVPGSDECLVEVVSPNGSVTAVVIAPGLPGYLGQTQPNGTNYGNGTDTFLPNLPDHIDVPLQVVAHDVGEWKVRLCHNVRAIPDVLSMSIYPFDISVTPTADLPVDPEKAGGRVFARRWNFHQYNCPERIPVDFTLYPFSETGPDTDQTLAIQYSDHVSCGFVFEASTGGLPTAEMGQSLPERVDLTGGACPVGYHLLAESENQVCSLTYPQEEKIYLSPPARARGGTGRVSVTELRPTKGFVTTCTGNTRSYLELNATHDGTYDIQIDVDQDGQFDPASGDLLFTGSATAGVTRIPFLPQHNDGSPLAPGIYIMQGTLTSGELHVTSTDLEQSTIRMFRIDHPGTGAFRSARQLWNLSALADLWPMATHPSTYPDGTFSGDATDSPVCNSEGNSAPNALCTVRRQSVGQQDGGNRIALDLATDIRSTVYTATVHVLAPDEDVDEDGLTNEQELCESATDATDPKRSDASEDDDNNVTNRGPAPGDFSGSESDEGCDCRVTQRRGIPVGPILGLLFLLHALLRKRRPAPRV